MHNDFDIQEKIVDGIEILRVIGELDALVAPKLKDRIAKLMDEDKKYFIIDFAELEHINSLGMGILRGKLRLLKSMNGDMKLIHLSDHIKELFEMIGLDEIFEIYENEEEAIASFQ